MPFGGIVPLGPEVARGTLGIAARCHIEEDAVACRRTIIRSLNTQDANGLLKVRIRWIAALLIGFGPLLQAVSRIVGGTPSSIRFVLTVSGFAAY